MKCIIIVLSLFMATVSLSQDQEENTCNQLPYAKVDQSAKVKGDLTKILSADLPSELKEDGEHTAVFKLVVDCNGKLIKKMYTDGNMEGEHQEYVLNTIEKAVWKPAVLGKKEVSSTVFVTVTITNGQVEVEIQ
ncbi:MAG: hypothetical protein WDZ35_14485 [Crocinitomicaceae bacterium]